MRSNGGTHASGVTKENKKYGVYLESLQKYGGLLILLEFLL